MIHLINAQNRTLYRDEMRAFHEERRRQFVDERGWRLSVRDGGEYDDYDDEQAFYLIGFSSEGEIEVGCRLRPTERGGVLPDIFPHLIAESEAPVRAPGVYECTRYFSTAIARGRAGFLARSQLHVAMIEAVQDRGGDRLLGFVDLPLLTHLRRFSGLRIRPVGLPADYDEGGVTIAFEIGVSAEDLAVTRRKLELFGRQLFVAPQWLPEGIDVHALEQITAVLAAGDEDAAVSVRSLAAGRLQGLSPQVDVDVLKSRLASYAA